MPAEEILARIDRTLDRIDARFEASERRWEERDRRWEERDKRWKRMVEENRRFNDALLERHAGITAEMIAAIKESSEMQSAALGGLQAEIADQRALIQAQTEAIMQVTDRLPPSRPQG